jgi:hypothetical protein
MHILNSAFCVENAGGAAWEELDALEGCALDRMGLINKSGNLLPEGCGGPDGWP